MFLKTLHILQKDTKVGSQKFGYQIWFCTRLSLVQNQILTAVCNFMVRADTTTLYNPCNQFGTKPK